MTSPSEISVLGHEEYDWVTLITCKGYDEELDQYDERLVARAVLISVDWETSGEEISDTIGDPKLRSFDDFILAILKLSNTIICI